MNRGGTLAFLLYLITALFFCQLQCEDLSHRGFFTEAAALYWQAEEEGLSYGIKSPSARRLATGVTTKSPDFDWDFGFRVGVGYRVPHDRWETLLQWTSLQTHSDATAHAGGGHVLFPVWQTPFSTPSAFADDVRAHWRLHLGLVDLLLNKPLSLTQTLTLTPKMGLRWGSVRQKYNIAYEGGSFPAGGEILIRMKNKFWGIGPHLGLLANFDLSKGFSLFADGAFSLLYGEFYLHQDADTLGSKKKLLGNHFIYRSSASILGGSAGLRWQRSFSGALKLLTLQLSWDQMLLFSQNQLQRFIDAGGTVVSNQGDLSIAGAQWSFRFDF